MTSAFGGPRQKPLLALIFPVFTCAAMLAQTAHYSGAQIPLPSLATYAYGIALDKDGDLFSVDFNSGVVLGVTASGNLFSPDQGLSFPWGIAVDGQGNLYIAERGIANPPDVVKETVSSTPYGNVYTRSLLPIDGVFNAGAIAVDSHGKVYIADIANERIIVETPAGSTYVQSTLPTSTTFPWALAVDAQDAVYIADSVTYSVVKETPSGTGYVESKVAGPFAKEPQSVAVDGNGNVYIDTFGSGGYADDFAVVKETPTQGAYQESPVAFAPNADPWNIAVDASGILYGGGSRGFEKLIPGTPAFPPANVNAVPPLYGSPEAISLLFTIDSPGTLGKPAVLTQGTTGLDFKERGSGSCTLPDNGPLFQAGDTCSVDVLFNPLAAGPRLGSVVLRDAAQNTLASGYVYGTGLAAQIAFLPATRSVVKDGLLDPSGVAVDALGNIYFAESGQGAVYKGMRNGNGFTLAIIASGLSHPGAVAIDGRGNLFVAATNTVYQETPVGTHYVQTAPVALPGQLNGIAVDGSGNLYVTSSASGDVHKESPQPDGSYVETSIGFGISIPAGVAVDGGGNIFVAEPRQGKVYEEALQADGSYRQSVLASGLAEPQGVALDGGGSVYITAAASGDLYKESLHSGASWAQSILATGLSRPAGIALDSRGNAYVALDNTGEVDMIDVADAPILHFPRTAAESSSSPQVLTVMSVGNLTLFLGRAAMGTNPSVSSGFALGAVTTCPIVDQSTLPDIQDAVDAGTSCDYAIDFTPGVSEPTRGSLGLLDNQLNQQFGLTKQTVELREAGITADATHTAVRVTPIVGKIGLGSFITVTVSDASYAPVVPQAGSVTLTQTALGKTTALNGGAAVPLVNGHATLNIIPTVAGEHHITAHYGGVDASFAGSSGAAMFNVVK